MQTQKSGFIALVGRPNTGKSTLLNTLLGQKVSIVSPKPQTTRNRIIGVLNTKDTQIAFLDTPGFHKPRNALGDYMVKMVKDSALSVDIIALVAESSPGPHRAELELLKDLKQDTAKVILVINKIDLTEKQNLLPLISAYSDIYPFESVVPVSARTGDGIDMLLNEFLKHMKPGPKYFPDDMYTDQPERQLAAELVREKLLLKLSDEVPHGTAVEVMNFKERENGIVDISVVIYCERKSHKGIIIGKNGSTLKEIAALARMDIENLLGCKVYLECWVKVKDNWRSSPSVLRNLGYE